MIYRAYPFYYGWIIVAVSFFTVFFVLGTRSCFGLFYTAILAEYGWGRAETAGAFSLMMVFHACMAPFTGILIDRFGPRKLFPMGAVIVGIGLAASSLISEIWHLYLCFGVITAMGTNMQSYAPHMSLIPRWFIRKRGLASGMVLSGLGPGTMLLALLIGFIIDREGWRYAYIVLSAIIFCVVVPMNALFQRNGPEEVGQTIEGAHPNLNDQYVSTDKNHRKHNERPIAQEIWTFQAAARTKAFWYLIVVGFAQGIMINTVMVHLAPHTVDLGFSRMLAASVVGVVGLLGSLGTILFGMLSDRVGRESGYFLVSFGASIGFLLLILTNYYPSEWLLHTFVIIYGVCQGGIVSIVAAATGDLFHSGNALGRIISTQAVSFGLGSATGAYLGGSFFDRSGSYTMAFIIVLFFIWIGAFSLWAAAPHKAKMI